MIEHFLFCFLYSSKNFSCLVFIDPDLLLRIYTIASSDSIPYSISAIATNTGALPKPATQCTPIILLLLTSSKKLMIILCHSGIIIDFILT